MIAYCASDLIWDVKIKSTAAELGISCQSTRSVEGLGELLADEGADALIVDLDGPDLAMEMIRLVRKYEHEHHPVRRIHILAFGPHVEARLLERAREAGADEVLPKGVFSRSLPDILSRLGSAAD